MASRWGNGGDFPIGLGRLVSRVHGRLTVRGGILVYVDAGSRNGSRLNGVPIAYKDLLSTKDVPTTAASRILEGFVPIQDADVVASVSRGLGEAMVGINVADIPVPHRLADRGW